MSDMLPIIVAELDAEERKARQGLDSVPIRSFRGYSPAVYLYPALLSCVLCGVVAGMGARSPEQSGAVGLVFVVLFFAHLSVLAVDLNRRASIVLCLSTIALATLAALSDGFSRVILAVLSQKVFMNPSFYWIWLLFLSSLIGVSVLWSRTETWLVEDKTLIRKRILGRRTRWPLDNFSYLKTIPSMYQYVLLRSGRLVLWPRRHDIPIIIDHVPHINRVVEYLEAHGAHAQTVDDDMNDESVDAGTSTGDEQSAS